MLENHQLQDHLDPSEINIFKGPTQKSREKITSQLSLSAEDLRQHVGVLYAHKKELTYLSPTERKQLADKLQRYKTNITSRKQNTKFTDESNSMESSNEEDALDKTKESSQDKKKEKVTKGKNAKTIINRNNNRRRFGGIALQDNKSPGIGIGGDVYVDNTKNIDTTIDNTSNSLSNSQKTATFAEKATEDETTTASKQEVLNMETDISENITVIVDLLGQPQPHDKFTKLVDDNKGLSASYDEDGYNVSVNIKQKNDLYTIQIEKESLQKEPKKIAVIKIGGLMEENVWL